MVQGREQDGFAEVFSYPDSEGNVEIVYYSSPADKETIVAPTSSLLYYQLPHQTRCFINDGEDTFYGRVIICQDENHYPRTYYVKTTRQRVNELLSEDQFNVRSYNKEISPVKILSEFSFETPFFFHQRYDLLNNLIRQQQLCGGITGLSSSKIEFFDHQVEIVRRVLQDSVMRYLLADEVGLGKTIEAGIIMRQVRLDWPDANMIVFAPASLIYQWYDELDLRFDLGDVRVYAHEEMLNYQNEFDLVVIDEAHRIVANNASNQSNRLYNVLKKLAKNTRNLLLLSATPILHKDAEMLSLLHLLDPIAYSLGGLDSFKKLLQNRQKIGRGFLALSKARLPALLKRNVLKFRELLPDDHIVEALTSQIINDENQIHDCADALKAHISESYRIHRRMIRTRRSWLIEDFGLGVRKVKEKEVEYELNEDVLTRLWERIEDWRIETASSPSAQDSKKCEKLIETYMSLSSAIASNHELLQSLIENELQKEITVYQQEILEEMLVAAKKTGTDYDRISLLGEILRKRLDQDTKEQKHVIFCSSSTTVKKISDRISLEINDEQFKTVHVGVDDDERNQTLDAFREDNNCRFLLADSVIEEGVNLQFAEGIILYDLPWSPMCLEQRLGRIDRINRVREVPCRVILTIEDENLALDSAWYKVLVDGFGVYEGSLSDLQFLIDKKIPELKMIAFMGGPSAIIEKIKALKEEIIKERERTAEQDVIDGMHLTRNKGSELRESLDDSDIESIEFSKSLKKYLEKNLKFRMWWTGRNTFKYQLDADEPLLPIFRLKALMYYLNIEITANRETAGRNLDLQLLRPGNAAVEECRTLLSWDNRGRVFAFWRHKNGIDDPIIVFRIILYIRPDIKSVSNSLFIKNWDPLAKNSLLRLIRGWMPELLSEIFLNETGETVPTELIQLCKKPFNKRINGDVNLGGRRSRFLKELVGLNQWGEACEKIATQSYLIAQKEEALINIQEEALRKAKEHFNMLAAQLKVREKSGMEKKAAIKKTETDYKKLHSLVKEIIKTPNISIDTIGAYIISDTIFWSIEDEEPIQ